MHLSSIATDFLVCVCAWKEVSEQGNNLKTSLIMILASGVIVYWQVEGSACYGASIIGDSHASDSHTSELIHAGDYNDG